MTNWIALVHVGARNASSPLTGMGAYVNAVGPASSPEHFRERIAEAVSGLDLDLLEIEDLEVLSKRLDRYRVDPEIFHLKRQAQLDRGVHFGTFYNYPATDA